MGPFIREKPTYDTAEKSLWFRLKRNPVTSTSFLPPEHLCLQLSPNTHICTDSQSLESFNVPNTGGGGREWRAFLRKLSSGREGKKAAGTASLSCLCAWPTCPETSALLHSVFGMGSLSVSASSSEIRSYRVSRRAVDGPE